MDGRPKLGREPAWHAKILILVGCALGILSAPIWLPLVPPAVFAIGRLQDHKERRFRRRMRGRGRYIEWADLVPRIESGEGTVVFEQGLKLPVRVWWTPDDLLASAPSPPPSEAELEVLTVMRGHRHHAFVSWCHRQYTDEDRGAALLTIPADMPDGFILAPYIRERHPKIRAVDTVYYRKSWYERDEAA